MSIKLIAQIFDINFKKPLLKFVLIGLADCANEEGECYPSIPTIAKKCSVSVRFVYTAITELSKMGYLKKQNRLHNNNRSRSNLYHILLPTLHTVQGDPAHRAPSTLHTVHPSKENRHYEPSKETISVIWEYWKMVMGHPRMTLDAQRTKSIRQGLQTHSTEDLKRAIDGCHISPFHSGQNPDGVIHDSLSLIFRNAEKIDYFIECSKPKKKTEKPKAKKEEKNMAVNIKSHIVEECKHIDPGSDMTDHSKYCHWPHTKKLPLHDEKLKSIVFELCDKHYREWNAKEEITYCNKKYRKIPKEASA